MEVARELKLYGTQASGFCNMIELALKLKNIPYEFIREDLANKSRALLDYNPIYKKVPVLVHNKKPIAESLVILQYIDETWKEEPALLPEDPYNRAQVRFWVDFYHQKLVPASKLVVFGSEKEELEKAAKELRELQMIMEEGTKEHFSGEGPFFHGAMPGLLDIVMAPSLGWFLALREVISVELSNEQMTPFLWSRLTAFSALEVAKNTLLPHDRLVEYARILRERVMAASRA